MSFVKKAKHFILLGLVSLGCIVIASITLNFSDLPVESIKNYFTPVQFVGGGNNFGGGIFWMNVLPNEETIDDGSNSVTCERQVGWFYYNPARGMKLWPLDPKSLEDLRTTDASYNDLTLDGGIYTSCTGSFAMNPLNRFGQINYNRNGESSQLLVGMELNLSDNNYVPFLKPSFVFFDGKVPLGFLYDSKGGAAWVGGIPITGDTVWPPPSIDCLEAITNACNNGVPIPNLFTLSGDRLILKNKPECKIPRTGDIEEIMMGIAIQGNVGLSKALEEKNQNSVISNAWAKTVFQGTNISNAQLYQTAAKNAEELCRGKEISKTSSFTLDVTDTAGQELVCISFPSYGGQMVTFDPANAAAFQGKSFVIQNADVYIPDTMEADQEFTLYVNNGNLLVNNNASLINIDKQGYPTTSSAVTQGIFLQGAFVVNGLMLGYDISAPLADRVQAIQHKLYINGKITTLNSLFASDGRIKQVSALDSSKDHTEFIALENIFTRSCNPVTGTGSDGASCADSNDEHAYKSLVIIDKKVESPLLGK